jgi:predicted nucleic acid-binding protein
MSSPRKLVLDANILLRAVFGNKVYILMKQYEDMAEFYAPDICIEEARRHIPSIAARRRVPPAKAEAILKEVVGGFVHIVDCSLYEEFEERARARISSRDADDWPVVATALLIDAPIWTEDQDFFGSGIATWTSITVELYLRDIERTSGF